MQIFDHDVFIVNGMICTVCGVMAKHMTTWLPKHESYQANHPATAQCLRKGVTPYLQSQALL